MFFFRLCFLLVCSFLFFLFLSIFFSTLYFDLPSVTFYSSFCSQFCSLPLCPFTYFLTSHLFSHFLNLLSFLFSFLMSFPISVCPFCSICFQLFFTLYLLCFLTYLLLFLTSKAYLIKTSQVGAPAHFQPPSFSRGALTHVADGDRSKDQPKLNMTEDLKSKITNSMFCIFSCCIYF